MFTCHRRWRLLTTIIDTFGSNFNAFGPKAAHIHGTISCSGLLPSPSSLPLNWHSSTSCFLQSHGIHFLMFPGLSGFVPRRHPYCSKIIDSTALGDLASSASHFLCPLTAFSTPLFPRLTEEIHQKVRTCK